MSGLRERQKAEREKRILKAAATKFRAKGYHAVRIEDLADAADVSVGTVYNYYRTKGDILIATVAMEVEEVLVAGAEVVATPPKGVHDALCTLIFGYYDHSLKYLSKEMWRSAMALSIEEPDTPNGIRYGELDQQLALQVTDLILALKSRGDVLDGVDAATIGQVIFNNLNQMFVEFVRSEKVSLSALKANVEKQMRPLSALIAANTKT